MTFKEFIRAKLKWIAEMSGDELTGFIFISLICVIALVLAISISISVLVSNVPTCYYLDQNAIWSDVPWGQDMRIHTTDNIQERLEVMAKLPQCK